jgi:hypothetical protein
MMGLKESKETLELKDQRDHKDLRVSKESKEKRELQVKMARRVLYCTTRHRLLIKFLLLRLATFAGTL